MSGVIKEKLKKERENFQKEVQSKASQYIGAGFGLVAGLAWNDAIKALIDRFFPQDSSGSLWAKFTYAILMTLVVALISYYLTKIFKKEEKKKEEK
ncbi:MAG: DUF5654 family protein [Patescibacteria group bacterium]